MSDKKVERKEFDAFLKEARSWETSRLIENEKSKVTAWRVAKGACLLAAISVAGISVMGPLKTLIPVVVRVDNATGVVDIISNMTNAKVTYEEALNKYFLQRYVRYREEYSQKLASEFYTNVGLMSAPGEQQRFYNYYNRKNPLSPLNVYKDSAQVRITFTGTSLIKPDVALVRYVKEIERGGDKEISRWAATVTFDFTKPNVSEKVREVNPLGFLVTEYRNDPEGQTYVMPEPAPAPAPAADPAATSIFPPQQQPVDGAAEPAE